ncbi:MAG: GAF domain-containing protein [Williamsia sp.]|nr:GAF domain-containing protein [Williamsia sp.]
MAIRDIVNREAVNVTNCEHEPIHIPGSIQPHGFLIGVTTKEFIVEFCSGNLFALSGLQPVQLLRSPLALFWGQEYAERFKRYIDEFITGTTQPFVAVVKDVLYNTTVHFSGHIIMLEMEAFPDGSLSTADLYNQTQKFVSLLKNTYGVQQLCQNITQEIRMITGYDRVMVYRFDDRYNGEVFAESKKEELPAFFGHHYPHSDIPSQARELYLRNLLRMIPDVDYVPVPIFTVDDGEPEKTLDMSHSILRSVSPIHIRYLKNMDVQATLTISLVLDGRLWGLIACHHYSPKLIPHYIRLSAQLQAHFLTSQIRVQETAEEYRRAQAIENDLSRLLILLSSEQNFFSVCHTVDLLSSFIGTGGTVIMNNNFICSNGNVPNSKEIRKLHNWLFGHLQQEYWYTSQLSAHYPDAASFTDLGAGILFHSLGREDSCIIWFRPEVVKDIEWAGNPTEAVAKDTSSGRLSPRTSFELWKEEVKGQSLSWHATELQAATSFAFALQKQIHMHDLQALTRDLQIANEELEDFHWIGAHDLNEPLRKIRMYASMILSKQLPTDSPSIFKSVDRIQNSAARMYHLIQDLLDYSAVRNSEKVFTPVDLNTVLSEVLKQTQELAEQKKALIKIEKLPILKLIGAQARELFLQMIKNAFYFSKEGENPLIQVTYQKVKRKQASKTGHKKLYHKISIQDNGLGFDPVYRKKIFRVFQRLNNTSSHNGTGIGLALCKKIMDNHDGFIRTDSKAGHGATFMLYFPG